MAVNNARMYRTSSTLHPYAFAMAPHNITDPIGANANAPITRSASKYQIHGNRLCGVAFIIGILNQSSKSTSLAWVMPVLATLLDDPVFLGPVPQRGELSRPRFVRCLKMRLMVRQNLPKRHSISARASWIGSAFQ